MQSTIGDRLSNEGIGSDEGDYITRATEAVDQTLEMVEALSELDSLAGSGWGSMEGEEEKLNMAFDPRVMSLLKDQDQFRKIINLMGRYKSITEGLKAEKVSEKPVPTRVTQGNDLSKLMASEFALLARPKTRKLFMKRYVEESLLQYDSDDEEPEGKGPLVILVDVSGSMRGKKQEIALALTGELMRIALTQHRKCTAIQFATTALRTMELDSSSQLIEFITSALKASGGTDFNAALKAGMDAAGQTDKLEADIVLVTDGQSQISNATNDRMISMNNGIGTRYFGLNVDGNNWPKNLQARLHLAMSINYRSDKQTDEAIELVFDQIVR